MSSNSSICYMVDDGSFTQFVDTRICFGTNEWQEISYWEYNNFIEHDDLNCQEEPYACWQSATSAFGDELYVALMLAIVVAFFVSETLVWNKKRALHDRFQREGIVLQATLSERLSEPVAVGAANRNPNRSSNSSRESHTYYYRDATQVLEFTNTRGETVVRKTSNDTILEDSSGTNRRQSSSTHRPQQQQQHPTTTPIYHLPDHPQSALHSDPGRLQSQLCGRSLCGIPLYAFGLGSAGYHVLFLYAPVWRGVVRQILVQMCLLPLTVGLGCWNGQKLYQRYEDEVLRNADRTEVDPDDARPRRQIVWGVAPTTEPTNPGGDAANHGSVIGTTYVPNTNHHHHPFEHVPDYYYEQWHETPSQPRRSGRGLVDTSGSRKQPESHTDGPSGRARRASTTTP